MTAADIRNEHLKLLALYLNGLAVAMVTAGVFGPIVSYAYGIIANPDPTLIFLSTAGCFVASAAIHLVSQAVLGAIR